MKNSLVLRVGAECLLKTEATELLEALKHELTIDNPKYNDAKKYGRWVGKNFKRQLYFYSMVKDGIIFPRGYASHAIKLCKQYTGQSPSIQDRRRELPEHAFTFTGKLRPYQSTAVNDVLQNHFGVLVAGTGSGKTVMALAVIAARKQPTLILLHSKELMYQWQDRIGQFLGIEAGLIGDAHYTISPISVAIVNTARKNLDELSLHFGQIIVDECHRVPASLFTDVVTSFDCKYSLGLSATAYRREDGLTRIIYLYMGNRAHQVDSRHLEETGAVLRPEFVQRQTAFSYFFKGDYSALIKALTKNEDRNIQIAGDIAAEAQIGKGTILVVSDRVAHCQRIAELLHERGVDSALLSGRLPADERSAIVDAVRQGEVGVLISTLQLVGEGFDAAGLTTLFLTTPIKFSGRLLQVVGRVLRPAVDKQAKVIDYVDGQVGVLRASARARQLTYQQMTEEGSQFW